MTLGSHYFPALYVPRHDAIECTFGDDLRLTFTVKDASGSLVDLSGATASYRVASKDFPITQIIEKIQGDGITISASSSQLSVSFNSDELLNSGEFVDQLQITLGSDTLTISQGKLTVLPIIE